MRRPCSGAVFDHGPSGLSDYLCTIAFAVSSGLSCASTLGIDCCVGTQGGLSRGTVVQRVYTVDGRGGSQLMGLIQRFGSDEQGALATDFFGQSHSDPFEDLLYGTNPSLNPAWQQQ
jgi:hypothetical protein